MLALLRNITVIAATLAAVAVPAQANQGRPHPGDVGPLPGGGGFVIQSCGETGSSAGWTLTRPNPGAIDGGTECPPVRGKLFGHDTVFDQTGLWVGDRLGNAGGDPFAAVGDHAELTFAPVAGTTITRLRYWRKVFKIADDNWHPYIALSNTSNVVDTCEINGAQACQEGADDWYPNDPNDDLDRTAYIDRSGLTTSSIIVGLSCRPNVDNLCGAGFSLPRAEAQIYSAFITLSDATAPTLGAPTGSGWSTDQWSQGTLPFAVSSTDATGIAATRVYADGSLLATLQRTCAYDRPRPCTDEPDGAVGIPTNSLADGPHAIAVAALDAAGNETRVNRPASLLVDNRAPSAPQSLTPSATTSPSNAFSAAWALPSDSGAPITVARYQLCQGASCGAVQTAPSTTSLPSLSLPGAGTWTLRVWLVDQLGHEDPGASATVNLTYAPPGPGPDPTPDPTPTPVPTPVPTPTPPPVVKASAKLKITTLRRAGRRVTVAGTLSAKASGRLTIRYKPRVGGRTRTTTKRVTIIRHAFKTTITLSKTLARARTGTVNVSYAGDRDTKAQAKSATVRLKR